MVTLIILSNHITRRCVPTHSQALHAHRQPIANLVLRLPLHCFPLPHHVLQMLQGLSSILNFFEGFIDSIARHIPRHISAFLLKSVHVACQSCENSKYVTREPTNIAIIKAV